ncbi:MAG: hypothetical protein ACI84R_001441, partial [Candidatus Azotimanducaceae bacterium]
MLPNIYLASDGPLQSRDWANGASDLTFKLFLDEFAVAIRAFHPAKVIRDLQ